MEQSKGEEGWPKILPTGEVIRELLSIARDSECLGRVMEGFEHRNVGI